MPTKIDRREVLDEFERGRLGEDNFYYVGAKDMLDFLIEKGLLEDPDNAKNKD